MLMRPAHPDPKVEAALLEALVRVLLPLARLAVARGLPFASVEELLRRAVAREAGVAAPSVYLHFPDLNALVAGRLHRLSATIVLVDNDGGGIFSFLPQAAAEAPAVGPAVARRPARDVAAAVSRAVSGLQCAALSRDCLS